jgi:hypothetical protein
VKKAGLWTKDRFLGLAVAIAVFLLAGSVLVQRLERKAYVIDVSATERVPSEWVALVAICDAASESTSTL